MLARGRTCAFPFAGLGTSHLRIVGCCAEAATLAGQRRRVEEGEGDQRLGIAPRRHWPPLIFPGAFFYLLPSPPPPPSPPAALRPLHCIAFPSTLAAVTLYLARARLFVTPTRTYPPLFLALLSRSNVLSAPSFPPSSLVLSPSFSYPSVPLSPSLFLLLTLTVSLSLPTSVCRYAFFYSSPSFLPHSRRLTTAPRPFLLPSLPRRFPPYPRNPAVPYLSPFSPPYHLSFFLSPSSAGGAFIPLRHPPLPLSSSPSSSPLLPRSDTPTHHAGETKMAVG